MLSHNIGLPPSSMGFKRVGVSYVGTYSTMVLRGMWSTWEVPTNGTWKVGIKDVSPINYGRTLAVGPSDAFPGPIPCSRVSGCLLGSSSAFAWAAFGWARRRLPITGVNMSLLSDLA